MYKNHPVNKKQALIYIGIALSKAWKYHHIKNLQNPDSAFSGKIFRRCTAMQLQTGFLLTSTDHLAQERREAADKCVEDVVPDLSYSQGRDCIISHLPFPLPPTFICHHSIQECISILKCHLHCDGRTLPVCWKIDKEGLDQAARTSTPSTLNMIELILDCPLQGSLRGTKHLRACSFGEVY